jgi:predicted nucleic acid-binding protein
VIYYFDTSALVKIYHQEIGSETVINIYHTTKDQIVISNLAIPEIFSTFHRKRKEGLISRKDSLSVLRRFFADITRRFTVTPLDQHHILMSLNLIERRSLRTLDALHLASALLLYPLGITFLCADIQLLEAAVQEGLAGLNPEQVF